MHEAVNGNRNLISWRQGAPVELSVAADRNLVVAFKRQHPAITRPLGVRYSQSLLPRRRAASLSA
jgi:hypothetical protein